MRCQKLMMAVCCAIRVTNAAVKLVERRHAICSSSPPPFIACRVKCGGSTHTHTQHTHAQTDTHTYTSLLNVISTQGINLLIATIAGVINVMATTPLWVVGARLATQRKKAIVSKQKDAKSDIESSGAPLKQASAVADKVPYKGVNDTISRIYNEEGWMALWKGVGPSLILVSNPSIQFVTYEKVRAFAESRAIAQNRQLNALEFFCLGAIAKAVATVLTYPLQVAQSKLRVDKGKQAGGAEAKGYTGTLDVLNQIIAYVRGAGGAERWDLAIP